MSCASVLPEKGSDVMKLFTGHFEAIMFLSSLSQQVLTFVAGVPFQNLGLMEIILGLFYGIAFTFSMRWTGLINDL